MNYTKLMVDFIDLRCIYKIDILAQKATKRCMMVSFVTDHKSESQLVEYHDNSSSKH